MISYIYKSKCYIAQNKHKEKGRNRIMKNNVLKKLATLVLVTIVTFCAIVATPMQAKAATIKEIYLVESEDKEYSWGFWQGFNGVMMDAEAAADGWTYKFTKVQDGLYKLSLSVTDDYTIVGASVSVDGVELYKSDANWSGEAGAASWTSFTDAFSSVDKIYIGLDKENNTIKVVEAPAVQETEAPEDTKDTEATKDTEKTDETKENETSNGYISAPTTTTSSTGSDSGMSGVLVAAIIGIILVVVVIAIAVVSMNKKKNAFDDDDDDF